MVKVRGDMTEMDKFIVGNIIHPDKPNIRFHNITFECETIEDASGNVFVWACKRERSEDGKIH